MANENTLEPFFACCFSIKRLKTHHVPSAEKKSKKQVVGTSFSPFYDIVVLLRSPQSKKLPLEVVQKIEIKVLDLWLVGWILLHQQEMKKTFFNWKRAILIITQRPLYLISMENPLSQAQKNYSLFCILSSSPNEMRLFFCFFIFFHFAIMDEEKLFKQIHNFTQCMIQ